MKIWICDTDTSSHRLIKLYCENHSDYKYVGDFDTKALKEFLLDMQKDMDIEKNMHRLVYYGYLNIFIIKK